MSRPRASFGIQPQIAIYSLFLGGACAYAAYNEKYVRNQDDLDTKLRDKYSGLMREAEAKTPQLTKAIRGKDMNLDGAMNKLVWGGKANLTQIKVEPDEDSSNDDTVDSSSSSSQEEAESRSKSAKKKRKKKKKKKKAAASLEERELESKKLVLQSLAAGIIIGAAAVAATVLVGSKPK